MGLKHPPVLPGCFGKSYSFNNFHCFEGVGQASNYSATPWRLTELPVLTRALKPKG
uniref:Uncharacterized protein n=1 Tax=Anguilla anguilla TaxID=7936 RepID=A0A0E9RLF3_ANGAN